MLVCAFFCATLHTRPRVQRAPGVPCSLFSMRDNEVQTSGNSCRENAEVHHLRSLKLIRNNIPVVPGKRSATRDPTANARCRTRWRHHRVTADSGGHWSRPPGRRMQVSLRGFRITAGRRMIFLRLPGACRMAKLSRVTAGSRLAMIRMDGRCQAEEQKESRHAPCETPTSTAVPFLA